MLGSSSLRGSPLYEPRVLFVERPRCGCDGGNPVRVEIGKERLQRAGIGDACQADAIVQDYDRRAGVALVLEGEEFCSERLGGGNVARLQGGKDRRREMRRYADGARGESLQAELGQMNDRGTLAEPADDPLRAGRLD